VQIVAGADARRAGDARTRGRQIAGRRDLHVAFVALHDAHHMPGGLGQHRFVGGVGVPRTLGHRGAQHLTRESLRRLRQPDLLAIDRFAHRLVLTIDPFHRLARGHRRQRRAGLLRHPRITRSMSARIDERTRGVVNQHDRARRQPSASSPCRTES
jgi:hypothetical protein